MVNNGPNNTNQLLTSVDHPQVRPLVVASIPLLHASLHLSHVVGSQGQTLKMTMSGYGTSRDEVVQGKSVEGTESTPRTLHGLIDRFSQGINPVWIIMGGLSILDIVTHLEVFEALCASIVDILNIGNELGRRRRSVGGRHFEWRTG